MNKQTFDQFRERARGVRLPDNVRDNVLSETSAEKNRAPQRRSVTRRAVVGVGLGAVGTAAALLVASIVTRPSEGDSAEATGNCWFALRAYAEGVEQDDGSLLAADDCFGGTYSWSEGDGGLFDVSTSFDVSCVGEGVDSITYELASTGATDGDVRFEWFALDRDNIEVGDAVGGSTSAFTVDYTVPLERVGYNVAMRLQAEGALREALDALYDAYAAPSDQGAVNEQIWRAFDLVAVCAAEEFAQRMAGVELTLSASLADGSAQTRRYRFDPVEDARERYAAHLGQITDLEIQREVEGANTSAQVQELMDNPPSLYLVTELDG